MRQTKHKDPSTLTISEEVTVATFQLQYYGALGESGDFVTYQMFSDYNLVVRLVIAH